MSRKRQTAPAGSASPRTAYGRKVFQTWEDFKNGVRAALPGGHDYDVLTSEAVNLADALVKLELPRASAREALQDLILMGIHHGTIFPGREGIAQTIKLRDLLRQ
jgi:hypothetical protein